MFHYLFCGQTFASTVYIPELPFSLKSTNDLTLNLDQSCQQVSIPTWHHHWFTLTGEKVISFNKGEDGYVLRFPSLADFSISTSVDQITCSPKREIPLETIRHLLLDQVLPRCLAQQGMLMLHASAVCLSEGVLLFIGLSGEGKSTLAGYFHQTGYQVISDDCVRLTEEHDSVKAIPSYNGLRLWPDTREFLFPSDQETAPMAHYSSKQRIQITASETFKYSASTHEGLPVLAIIVLSSSGQESVFPRLHLKKLSRREAFIEIMKQTFLLDVTDHNQYARLMQVLGRIIPQIRIYKLTVPHDFNALPDVRKLVLDELELSK